MFVIITIYLEKWLNIKKIINLSYPVSVQISAKYFDYPPVYTNQCEDNIMSIYKIDICMYDTP